MRFDVLLVLILFFGAMPIQIYGPTRSGSTDRTFGTNVSGAKVNQFRVGQSNPGSGIFVEKTWGGDNQTYANGVAVDPSGNIYITGYTNSFGPGSPSQTALVLLKYSLTGGLLWQRIWSGTGNGTERGQAVVVDSSGDVYVTGGTTSYGAGDVDVLLLKFDASGNLLWQRTYGGKGFDVGEGIALDSAGQIYVAGIATSIGGVGRRALLLKFDASGNLVWQRTWGGRGDSAAYGIAVDHSDMVYLTGYYLHNSTLLKFDSNGSLMWQETWAGKQTPEGGTLDESDAVAVDSQNDIYLTGQTASGYSFKQGGFPSVDGYNVPVLKFASDGSLKWAKTFGLRDFDIGRSLAVNPSGNVYLTGETSSSFLVEPIGDAFLLELDSLGSVRLAATYGQAQPSASGGEAVAVDSFGGPVIAGNALYDPSTTLDTAVANSEVASRFTAAGPPPYANITMTTPALGLGTPTGNVAIPSGIQTYSGEGNLFLLEASPLYEVSFLTSPGGQFGITFNGTYYLPHHTAVLPNMVSTASAGECSPPSYCGVYFSHWWTEGGVSVGSSTDNPTTVTISGPGSLLAVYTFTSPTQPLSLDPITLLVLSNLLVVTLGVIALFFLRRQRNIHVLQGTAFHKSLRGRGA